MKLTTLLLLIATFQVFASNVYSQKTELTLNLGQTSVAEVLSEIESQSEFYFLFNQKLVDTERLVNIQVSNKKVEEILDRLFLETSTDYVVMDRQIVLSPKEYLADAKNVLLSEVAPQPGIITGTVTGPDGEPLPGVSISVKGTFVGTISDQDGKYSLSGVPEDAIIVFSFVGMITQEILVESRTIINHSMEEDVLGLEEVVVVGYGTVKKSDLTGAVASVSSDVISEQPSLRVEEAMQGKVAGVLIQRTSGSPDGTMRVRIRGTNSLEGDNAPLYVIDGVLGASMASINVNDIESVEVLKDASATAIYGSRGSNGVILITTKSAKAGETTWSFNARVGADNLIREVERADPLQFMEIVNTAYDNYGLETVFTDADFSAYRNDPSLGTHWPDEIFRTGITQDYQLAAQGGSEKINYYVSGTYNDVEGVVLNDDFRRIGLRSNLDFKLNDRIRMTFNMNATNSLRDVNGVTIRQPLIYSPLPEIYDEFGEYTLAPSIGIDTQMNPLYYANDQRGKNNTNRLFAMTRLEVDLFKDLTYSFTGAAETSMSNESRFYRFEPGLDPSSSTAKVVDRNYLMWQVTNQLTYAKTINDHSLTVSAVQEAQAVESAYNTIDVTGFVSNSLKYHNLSLAENSIVQSDNIGNQLASFLGRVNYSFRDKYLITASMRADGSSRFAPGNKWSYFPSAALAWKISEEDFFPQNETVSGLKLRLSYGEVGSQAIQSYQTLASLVIPTTGVPVYEGALEVPILLGDPANPDLVWETTSQYDVGLDLRMFSGRVNINADYYYKKTYDLLYAVQIPYYAGFVNPTQIQNIGQMDNRGIELFIDATAVQTNDFTMDVAFTFSNNKNRFLGIEGVEDDILVTDEQYQANNMGGVIPFTLQKGEPLANIRGLVYEGPYTSADADLAAAYGYDLGAPKYTDQDENGTINADDAIVLGNGAPDYTWGLNLKMYYKGFDFSVFVQSVQGFDILNIDKFMMTRYWTYPGLLDAWSTDNENAHQWAHTGSGYTNCGNSLYVEDGSFIRLKNVMLGYTLPRTMTSKIGIKEVRFYVNLQNYLTFTEYSWFDPEATATGDNDKSQGVNLNSYPNPKSINFGVNLKF